jgi:hypothetical protein
VSNKNKIEDLLDEAEEIQFGRRKPELITIIKNESYLYLLYSRHCVE